MIHPCPKPITYKNPKYLDWLRGQPCVTCGRSGEPHHIRRIKWGAGVGKKSHDYCCVSLCRQCHTFIHAGKDDVCHESAELIIIDNLMKYIEGFK